MALRDQDAGPARTAVTALVLIFVRNMIMNLRQLVPNGNFNVLDNPFLAPSLLTDYLIGTRTPIARAESEAAAD